MGPKKCKINRESTFFFLTFPSADVQQLPWQPNVYGTLVADLGLDVSYGHL